MPWNASLGKCLVSNSPGQSIVASQISDEGFILFLNLFEKDEIIWKFIMPWRVSSYRTPLRSCRTYLKLKAGKYIGFSYVNFLTWTENCVLWSWRSPVFNVLFPFFVLFCVIFPCLMSLRLMYIHWKGSGSVKKLLVVGNKYIIH